MLRYTGHEGRSGTRTRVHCARSPTLGHTAAPYFPASLLLDGATWLGGHGSKVEVMGALPGLACEPPLCTPPHFLFLLTCLGAEGSSDEVPKAILGTEPSVEGS